MVVSDILSKLSLTASGSELDDITRIINMHCQTANTGAYVIGTLYNYVVEKRLALIAGYKDTRSYFAQNVKALSQATLGVYGRAAKLFSEQVVTQYGAYKLNALNTYVEVAALSLPTDPAGFPISVPQDNGTAQDKLFEECSVDEIERAIKAKRAAPKSKVPVGDQARLIFLWDSLSKNFDQVADVRMTASCPKGKTLITLQEVPLAELQRLMKALQEGMDAEPTLGLKVLPAPSVAAA